MAVEEKPLLVREVQSRCRKYNQCYKKKELTLAKNGLHSTRKQPWGEMQQASRAVNFTDGHLRLECVEFVEGMSSTFLYRKTEHGNTRLYKDYPRHVIHIHSYISDCY